MSKQSLAGEMPIKPSNNHRARFSFLHALYAGAWRTIGPLIPAYLRRRALRGKEDPTRLSERFGVASRTRPPGKLLWIHGASVGESLSALPLLERLLARDPDLHALVTTGTVTSARLLEDRLPARTFHQYIPLDHPVYADKFFTHWHPDTVLWLESEFWPNLLGEITSRSIPAALVNSRLSDHSFRRWRRMPRTIAQILNTFRVALPKDEDVARKLAILAAETQLSIQSEGNLKLASLPLPVKESARLVLEKEIGLRPVIIAAQTVEGEEDILARIFQSLKTAFPNLLLIIVPKHPARGDEIQKTLSNQGLVVATRSKGELPDAQTQIYLADTMGELGLFYRLVGPVVLGRSLVPGFGGSNPLEPARFGRCIIQGVHTGNFGEETKMLADAEGSLVAANEAELKTLLEEVLRNEGRAEELGMAAENIVRSVQGVIGRYEEALLPLLPNPQEPEEGKADARS